jgi:hypothetical protein
MNITELDERVIATQRQLLTLRRAHFYFAHEEYDDEAEDILHYHAARVERSLQLLLQQRAEALVAEEQSHREEHKKGDGKQARRRTGGFKSPPLALQKTNARRSGDGHL